MSDVRDIMSEQAQHLIKGGPSPVKENPEWDALFLRDFSRDLTSLDSWTDGAVLEGGGSGGGEVRLWIAAAAAGQAAGAGNMIIDFFTGKTTLGFGVGITHADHAI